MGNTDIGSGSALARASTVTLYTAVGGFRVPSGQLKFCRGPAAIWDLPPL